MRNIILPALVTFTLAISTAPASAETRSIRVQYADLNLNSPEGMATLEGRIEAAAKQICGKAEVRRVQDGVDHERCVRETQASVTLEVARLTNTSRTLALSNSR
ncbi:UrcA family protein [Croceibacterium sp. LX-88]|jgi:UrcA family protein|uniref:UrcA family protein n=1 Tax=Croceibacterium selenioxidans TaxID=2838833 RepID=A0ABS5W4J4_9SPHN|nr:UrcA family protein [Croceibacterium selenioxidans]MBT2134676.1 UrcA family protein [Croceibacterium selenioxidans]